MVESEPQLACGTAYDVPLGNAASKESLMVMSWPLNMAYRLVKSSMPDYAQFRG